MEIGGRARGRKDRRRRDQQLFTTDTHSRAKQEARKARLVIFGRFIFASVSLSRPLARSLSLSL